MADSNSERATLFGQYYLENYQQAYQMAFAITQDRHLAHDAVQDAYVCIIARLVDGEAMPKSAGCVVDLAMKRAKDLLKKQKRQPIPVSPVILASLADKAQHDGYSEPYQQVERQELVAKIAACLQQLQPDHRHAILLSYKCGHPDKEVARIMGVPLATVKTWLRRAKAKLKTIVMGDPAMSEYLPKEERS